MNKTFSTLLISGTLSATLFASPIHAAVIDQVKSKVDAIKTDTASLKTRTGNISAKADELVLRAEETAATANAIIAETDLIKQALAPVESIDNVFQTVRDMKDRFTDMQFDPAELLESDQLSNVVAILKARKQAAEERLNDPELEPFRVEFLVMLEQLRELVENEPPAEGEIMPFQLLVENAPAPVIAVLKMAVGPVFPSLRDKVAALSAKTEKLRALGVLGYGIYQDAKCERRQDERETALALLYKSAQEQIDVIRDLKLAYHKIEVQEWELGIHGYTGVKVTTGDDTRDYIQSLIIKFEARKAEFDLKREKMNFEEIACGA